MDADLELATLGHSNRTAEDFLALLRDRGIAELVDVRRFPVSRRHPWFSSAALVERLAAEGIGYRHEGDLGGHRQPRPGSPNAALRSAAFRGYADHLATAAFGRALERLLLAASARRVAVMCAEAAPERCHRRILADLLVARGVRVVHLLAAGETREHRLDPRARPGGEGGIVYPGAVQGELFGGA